MLIVAAAANVTILKSTGADFAGTFLNPYYENVNAPVAGCTLPCLTVDTQTTEPTRTSVLSSDGNWTGTWSSATSFTITSVTTAHTSDVILLNVVTYKSASEITVSSVTDTAGAVSWRTSFLTEYTDCSSTQETTDIQWYGVASGVLSSDTITITLSATPTAASAEAVAISGAATSSPIDTSANGGTIGNDCSSTAADPSDTISTANANDFVIAFGGYTSKTESAGNIGATAATLLSTVAGRGYSLAVEYSVVSTVESGITCTFGKTTTYWADICDAVVSSASFTLPAGESMYLWSPQFASAKSIPASSLSLQLFADMPAPAVDGSAEGTWSSGTSFALSSLTTTDANDVVVLSIVTYHSGSSVAVSSISDSASAITWQSSARHSYTVCTGAEESTEVEWYGIASSALSSDTITVQLASTPTTTAASGIAIAVSGADTITPFDPASGLPDAAVSSCSSTSAAPTVSSVSTVSETDFVFSLFGTHTSVTETAGTIGVTKATLVATEAGVGYSNAVEYVATTSSLSSSSCAFGKSTTYWGALCDAIMPAPQTVTVSYYTTDSAGTVQSTMASNSPAATTALYQPLSVSSSAGTVPASGYIEVVITGPASAALTIFWGSPKPTLFEVAYTYRA